MKIALKHYLNVLKERDELEVLIVNILISEGFHIVKIPTRGKREFGVDIAAYRNERGEYHLYLIQVKSGPLDRKSWDTGVNSVRTSLSEAIDKDFSWAHPPSDTSPHKHLIVAFNGYEHEDVKELTSGFRRRETANHRKLQIDFWNESTLLEKIEKSLSLEGLVPTIDPINFKKILAFADIPHHPFVQLRALLTELSAGTITKEAHKVRRLFSTVRVITRVVATYARAGGAFANAVIATEISILTLAHWCQENKVFTPTTKEQFEMLLTDYASDLSLFLERLSPLFAHQYGLALSGITETFDYPTRTFEILSMASIYALLSMHLGLDSEKQACLWVDEIIQNNPSAERPLLDNHGVSIGLAMLVYLYAKDPNGALQYARAVLDNLALRSKMRMPLPELRNRLDFVVESLATGKKPPRFTDSSSTILPLLFEVLLAAESRYWENFYQDVKGVFSDIDLQLWYPSTDYGKHIFRHELFDGAMETSIELPENTQAFIDASRNRHAFYSSEYPDDKFTNELNGFVLFISFRHYKTPIFPFFWRDLIPAISSGACGPA